MTSIAEFIQTLETFAPLRYAGNWDNVGLLVDPPHPSGLERAVTTALLTIDLTEAVLEEAIDHGAELIVAYHPTIFSGLKRLTMRNATQRVVLRAIQHNIVIHSPHTALDAAPGGLNDWLLEAFEALEAVAPIEAVDPDVPEAGAGRLATLCEPQPLDALVARIKAHLSLPVVRVASAAKHASGARIARVAVCPGAGGSLFSKVRHADLFLTGEMRHHDILARTNRGASVILTDHTNTERGYLPRLRDRLLHAFADDVAIHVSDVDRDPLSVV